MNLLFPFMIYEAKALAKPSVWSDPANEAWEQGDRAARMYLALKESLMRVPGRAEKIDRTLQHPPVERSDPRCFLLMSVGPQWTIYNIYPNEVHDKTFYTWSNRVRSCGEWLKIWNGDVQSERSAWELLYQVDMIQQWARTSYRNMIWHYLRSWYDAAKKDILFEWKMDQDGQRFRQPRMEDINTKLAGVSLDLDLTMPFWAMAVGKEWRAKLKRDAHQSFREAYKHNEEGRELEKTWRQDRFCTHENVSWEHRLVCMPEDKEFVKKWLAGPGQKWQE